MRSYKLFIDTPECQPVFLCTCHIRIDRDETLFDNRDGLYNFIRWRGRCRVPKMLNATTDDVDCGDHDLGKRQNFHSVTVMLRNSTRNSVR
jgi:hypothetical protein